MVQTSIISVNYNQSQATLEFLRSIKEHTVDNNIEIILVDNGSTQNHEEIFKKEYPTLNYIRSDKNLGFAGGNNLGIQKAKGDFLLFLNNDTEVTEGFLDTLINEFDQNPNIGILSPLIIYYENKEKIQYAGFSSMNYITGRNKAIGNFETDIDQYKYNSHETGFSHGAAMMCRKKDILDIGLMEENYFLYYEELDWCEKFKKAGKKIWFTGKAKIYHKESISVGKESSLKIYFMYRNRMLFIRKNTNFINTLIFSIYFICLACPKTIVNYFIIGKRNLIPCIIKAIIWNLTNHKNSTYLGYKA